MPQESREILFSMNEFLDALMRYNQMRGGERYQLAQLTGIGVDRSRGGAAELTVSDGTVLRFSEADILSSLIAYCIEHGVPLPARGEKRVHVTDEGVELSISATGDWARGQALPSVAR